MFESRQKVGLNHRRGQKVEKEENLSVTKSLNENFNQYLINTTLHGLKYIGDRTITWFERWVQL